MKRKKLLIFGIFLSFFISCSDELERIPPTTGEVEFKDFGIRDARYYFEENATDLAPLRFTDRVAAKSSALPAVVSLLRGFRRAFHAHRHIRWPR